MSLTKLRTGPAGGVGGIGGFLDRSLSTEMTRLEFLQMGGALLLTVFGVQNLLATFSKHTRAAMPSGAAGDPDGFGSRKFGQ